MHRTSKEISRPSLYIVSWASDVSSHATHPSKVIKLLQKLLLKSIAPVALILIYLAAGVAVATGGTSIFHTFGDGFSLTDDKVRTSVIVRNDAPISFPGIELPYSYDALIEQGSARCQVRTVEGVKQCGTTTVGLGTLKPGENKSGPVEIFPNHANFTVRFYAYAWVFWFHSTVANVAVSCSTSDGRDYTCVTSGEGRLGAPPAIAFCSSACVLVNLLFSSAGALLMMLLLFSLRRRGSPVRHLARRRAYSDTRGLGSRR
jgi:hypothetical protein